MSSFVLKVPSVTSLAGVSSAVATLAVYGSYAALVDVAGHSGAFAMLTLPCLAVAVWLSRGLAKR